ncbi:protein IQ-DOMAIN 32 [Cornus florida]|uniref:protein IQ-DOMAIN 32 n=1 Tax=Cornus florida TaxID=4283 RepID=UPI002896E80D|nr:protein IQ-DOMAIN 32 [Cornus florida]
MGRSTASCFKIISCGSDSVDKDDLAASEGKGSSDKRGWSFRKRSSRHRVLSNTVISETPSSGNKESPESATFNFQTQANSIVTDKTSATPWTDEKLHLSNPVNSKVSETVISTEEDTKVDVNLDESVIVVIQVAVRGFLAQRALLKLKNLIKLQAAVRGHLVRRHAVGTLRCAQAIVKMQALVRARHARLFVEGSCTEEKLDRKHGNDNVSSKFLEKENSVTKPTLKHTSIENLLKNGFARQLLESTPRTKPMHIKCDPSRSDSTWKWLERWMSVSSTGVVQSHEPELSKDQQEQGKVEQIVQEPDLSKDQQEQGKVEQIVQEPDLSKDQQEQGKVEQIVQEPELSKDQQEQEKVEQIVQEPELNKDQQEQEKVEQIVQEPELSKDQQEQEKVEHSTCKVETGIPSESYSESTDTKTKVGETVLPSESANNLITSDADNFNIQAHRSNSSSINDNLEEPQPENTYTSNLKEITLDLLPNQTTQSDLVSQTEINAISSKPEMESGSPKHSITRFAPEQETEGKKFAIGSRKASNPAFIAAQSKFEELSSTVSSARSISSSNQDVGGESSTTAASSTDNAIRTSEIDLAEKTVLHNSSIQVGGSECGTELSISSTLDSPDRCEVGTIEFEQEAKVSEEVTCNIMSSKNQDVEAEVESTIPGSDVSYSIMVHPEKLDNVNVAEGEPVNSVIAADSSQVRQESEKNASVMQIELDPESGHQAYKSSPEGSPRSHMTVPETQETPSSQISVNAKRSRSDKKGSNSKRRSLSGGKRSAPNTNNDSGARSSLEQLPKDHKTGKRRNSFGSARPDHVDQEPRDSTGGNSLPSYMQATESARAKALANSSPRSSPDVQEKDVYVKKRHSLPGANGRQGSPRIQRSLSQANHGVKGNGTHPHERKWQR